MSHKKLTGLLIVPLALAVIGGGVTLASHHASAQSQQAKNQAAVDTLEQGDQPDKPGQNDPQDQQNQNEQQDSETND